MTRIGWIVWAVIAGMWTLATTATLALPDRECAVHATGK